jgi:ammonia channel protein AmtB
VDDRGSGSGAVAGLGTIAPASGFVLPLHGVIIATAAQKMSMVMMI